MSNSSSADRSTVILTYGPSKFGKTTDLLYSFPTAVFIGTPAAILKPAAEAGIPINPKQIVQVSRISEATELIRKLPASFEYIVGDDFSLLSERTCSILEKKLSGYHLWGGLRDESLEFRDAARMTNRSVIMSCHDAPPHTNKDGFFIRGGPLLHGKLPEEFPKQADTVLRVIPQPGRQGWACAYSCTGPSEPTWVTGDRHGAFPPIGPMNLREAFLTRGIVIPRAPGFEWLDEAAGMLAQLLLSVPENDANSRKQILQAVVAHVQTKYTQNPLHIRWALRDGSDRAELARLRANPYAAFGL